MPVLFEAECVIRPRQGRFYVAQGRVDGLERGMFGAGGTTAGDGVYTNGTTTTVLASPNTGYRFVNWTENGAVVSTAPAYTFTNIVNRSLLAAFVPAPMISFAKQSTNILLTWPTNFSGYALQQNSNLKTTNWITAAEAVSIVGTNYNATALSTNGPRFFHLSHP